MHQGSSVLLIVLLTLLWIKYSSSSLNHNSPSFYLSVMTISRGLITWKMESYRQLMTGEREQIKFSNDWLSNTKQLAPKSYTKMDSTACIYICNCVWKCVSVCLHACVHECICVPVCMHVCIHVCVLMCACDCSHGCVACMSVCLCVCMCVNSCAHGYTHRFTLQGQRTILGSQFVLGIKVSLPALVVSISISHRFLFIFYLSFWLH